MRKLILFLATGAGSGYAPLVPGTFGSAAGLALFACALLAGLGTPGLLIGTVAITAVGVWASDRAEHIFERRDDGRIVIDEVAGMWVSLLLLPASVEVALTGFVLFRLFDILKPPPARAMESLPGGLGVMADDLVAGVYANIVGQIAWRVVWPGGWL
jgi:phosphatidylglycerophosphatase A